MTESRVTCHQCGLPLPEQRFLGSLFSGRPDKRQEDEFCCLGCYVVHEVTGETGIEGEASWNLSRLGLGAFLSMIVMAFSLALYSETLYPVAHSSPSELSLVIRSLSRYILLAFSTPVVLLLGFPILKASVKRLPYLGMDALIAIGTVSAYGLSAYSTISDSGEVYFDTVTMVLVLVTLGRFLEAKSKASTKKTINNLLSLSPEKTLLLKDGNETIVPVGQLLVGDKIRLRPGDLFPADGNVIEGEGSVDESMLSGEALPVFKTGGSPVYSGTINLDGSLVVGVSHIGEDRVLSKIAGLLDEVRQHRAPVEKLADRISGFFIPAVIIVALSTFVGWSIDGSPEAALMNSLSVLLVSCPCALGIATSLAIWTAVQRAAEEGVLIQRGEYLERLAGISGVFFDKTGTLTTGEIELDSVYLGEESTVTREELISIVASLEKEANHPLARSITKYAMSNNIQLSSILEFKNSPGMGVRGRRSKDGTVVTVGRLEHLEMEGLRMERDLETVAAELSLQRKTLVYCGWGNRVQGIISFHETEREEFSLVLRRLRREGVEVRIVTGDRNWTGDSLRENEGVEVRNGLLPAEKVREIEEAQKEIGPITMVGDGINDAPALARADVGIAMGCGADITRETADICLVGNDLSKLPWLIDLARKTRRIIRVNLFWAFLYNAICISLAVTGQLTPIAAAIAMVLSSLFVIGNSARLRKFSAYG